MTLLPAVALVAGCASTVQQTGFSRFTSALQKLRTGTDRAISQNEDASREDFILEVAKASLARNGAATVNSLHITAGLQSVPFSWQMDVEGGRPPLFMVLQRFRDGVYAVNTALVTYSELLGNLASPDVLSVADLDAETRDVNAGLRAGMDMLGVRGSGQNLALFSTVATEMARQYLERRRRAELGAVLGKTQPSIEELSKKLQEAVRMTARILMNNYDRQYERFVEDLLPGSSTALSNRTKAVKRIVKLNETYIENLAVLNALYASYGALPAAHRELRRAVIESRTSFASIEEILENGKRLSQLYEKLRTSDANE
ncbi:MAG: hypothetical protein GXP48_07770 [Acidobacteria bacterium]|nr:hypothetical protein [Acidobacteriota bacterium]